MRTRDTAVGKRLAKVTMLFIAVTTILSLSQAHAWKFVCVGDSRGSTNGVNQRIVSEIADAIVAESADLVLVPGDLVDSGNLSSFRYWKELMAPVYDAGIAIYPVRGNHDLGSGWVTVFGEDIPDNGPSGEINYTYAVSHKNALFLGMDQLVRSRRNNQAWLDDQLAANTNPHIFVFGHYPAFKVNHADCLDDYATARNTFWNSLTDAGSRIYFAGHDHFMDIARLDDGDGELDNDLYQYIVGTMGAPPYSKGPYNGNNGSWSPQNVLFESNYGYVVVEINGSDVTVTWKRRASAGVYQTAHVFDYDLALSPVADIVATPTSGDAPLEVTFDASASSDPQGGTIVGYEWDFGDFSTAIGETASHRYDIPGTYIVMLTVTNDSAETTTATVTITVFDPLEPPAEPTGLVATAGDQEVILDWANNAEPDLSGYSVYRSESSGGPYSKIASVSASAYTDDDVVNEMTYHYVVTAIDDAANESDFSDEVSATPVQKQAETIAFDGFESKNFRGGSGWLAPWRKRGDVRLLTTNPAEGQYYVRLRRKSGYLKRPLDLTHVTGVRLSFWSRVKSLEGSERALVQVSTDGSNYTSIMEFTAADSDNTWRFHDIDLSAYDNTERLRIVFDAEMTSAGDKWFLDDIEIKGVR